MSGFTPSPSYIVRSVLWRGEVMSFDYLHYLIQQIELTVVKIFVAVSTIVLLIQVIKSKLKK
jgi:hypothetical protein